MPISPMNRIQALVAAIVLQATVVFADAPYEVYTVTRSSIPATVLKSAIGVLTLNSGVKKTRLIRTYKRSGTSWAKGTPVDGMATKPVSNFGYHPPMADDLLVNFRYPIVGKDGDFLQVVFNADARATGWVNAKEIAEDFYSEILLFDELPKRLENQIDPRFGNYKAPFVLYSEPDRKSSSEIVPARKYGLLKPMKSQNGFLQVGIYVGGGEEGEGEGKLQPIGWIPIRDESGELIIWVANADNC